MSHPRTTLACSFAAILVIAASGVARAQPADAAPDCVHAWGPACEAALDEAALEAEERDPHAPEADAPERATTEAAADRDAYRATAVADAPIASTHTEDPTVSGTSIPLRDRGYAGEEIADVLPEVPGVRLTNLGAPGQFIGVRLRGGSYQQTTVLLGDLPLASPDTPFDFSLVPTWAIERVEVYRGGAPVWLGGGGIGGVVRLVPRRTRGGEADLHLAGGSFGTYQLAGGLGAASSRVATVAAIGLAGTRGDYPFVRDPTPLVPGDETIERRANGDNVRGSVLLGATVELDAGTLETLVLAVGRQGGAIGGGLSQALHARSVDRQLWSSTAFRRTGAIGERGYRLEARFGAGVARSGHHDPFGEIPPGPNATDDLAITTDTRLAGSVELAGLVELVTVAAVQTFDRRPHDSFDAIQEPASRRVRYDHALELRLHGGADVRWEVRPSARLTVSRGALRFEELNVFEDRSVDDVSPTFRVGAVVAPGSAVAIRASVHSGVRLPSLLELFGDRAGLEANPELDPEHSMGGDVGVSTCGTHRLVELSGDLTAAVDRRRDLIQLRKNGYQTAQAINVEAAWVASFELYGRLVVARHLRADLQATYLLTRTDDGFELPMQPALSAFGRVEGGTEALGAHVEDLALYVETLHVGASSTDTKNLAEIPARTIVNVGARARLFDDALSASVELADAFDVRGFDLANYPLPGRRFAVQLEYRKDL